MITAVKLRSSIGYGDLERLEGLYDERLSQDQMALLGVKEVTESKGGKVSMYFVNERAEAAEAKLSAMEKVVEAGRILADQFIQRVYSMSKCTYCGGLAQTVDNPIPHDRVDGSPCPVGIVLSFTKKEE